MVDERVCILGVGVHSISQEAILGEIAAAASSEARLLILHANLRGLNMAYTQPWLREFYNRADLVYCDGTGVKLGARILGKNIQERYTLADWIWPLAGMAASRGFRLYLLGNPPGVADKAASKLQARLPQLQIAGSQHGYFDKSPESAENEAVVARINDLRPEILLVGFGMPVQERWLCENWPRLKVNVAISCGALFEIISGDLKRGPRWMTDNYLEWLSRIWISPRRVAGRYVRDIPVFYYRVFKQKLHGE